MKTNIKVYSILIFLLAPFFSKAVGHISGYISLKHVSAYTYDITFTDYVNSCDSSGSNTDTVRVWFDDGISQLVYGSVSADTICTCQKVITYQASHTYMGSGVYHIWVDAGARVPNISNMTNSSFQDMLIYNTLIINPLHGSVSSPLVANPPTCSYGCTTQCYYFNPDATLLTGDSISYMLTNCLAQTGKAIGYYVPQNVSLNSVTGELSWCNPTSDGLYNFAVDIISYQPYVTNGDTFKLAFDTEEVELQVNVQNDCALGINQIANAEESVAIYPNPSNGIFNLVIASGAKQSPNTIEIYNVLGERVYDETLRSTQGDNTINLSNQPNGIYLYRIISQNGDLIGEGKLVIQR